CSDDAILVESGDDQTGIVSAEAEAVGNGAANALLTSAIGDKVQIARRIRRVQINGGMNHGGLKTHDGGGKLRATGSAEQVTDHTLGAADGQFARVRTKDLLDGAGFSLVPQGRAGAVSVDVLNVFRVEPRVFEGKLHGASGAGAFRMGSGDVM